MINVRDKRYEYNLIIDLAQLNPSFVDLGLKDRQFNIDQYTSYKCKQTC